MMKFPFFALCALLFFGGLSLHGRPWKAICDSGKLRVLTTTADLNVSAEGLNRCEMPIHRERALLHAFAKKHHLEIEYVQAENFTLLFHRLESDEGDLVSSNLTETKGRRAQFLLSVPFDETSEVVFTSSASKSKGDGIESLRDMKGVLLPGTSYVEHFQLVFCNQPEIKWQALPETISHSELIEKVANGEIDYSVLNESDLDAYLAYNSGIRKLFPLKLNVPLVFAANKKSVELIRQLNLFIEPPPLAVPEPKLAVAIPKTAVSAPKTAVSSPKTAVSVSKTAVSVSKTAVSVSKTAVSVSKTAVTPKKKPVRHTGGEFGDLAAIKKRGYIRVLMRNEFFGCYLHRGELCGFEYELAKRFAQSIGVAIVTVIPTKFEDMVKFVENGEGDFIAANFSCTPERVRKYPKLAFCSPYGSVSEVLIGRSHEKIAKLSDLAGRHICVRKGNSYYQTLLKLQKAGKFIIDAVPENESMIEIFKNVVSGKYDLTVADETYWELAETHHFKVKKLLTLSENNHFSWVVRKGNPQLAAAVNAFFKKEYRGTFYNICWKRYYVSSKRRQQDAPKAFKDGKLTISPYDKVFQKYGKAYNFDWYFLAAQSYQESRFKANTVNHIGAVGLMQVTPVAAKEVGVSHLTEPENGIKAGAMYLAKLRKKLDGKVRPEDQLCFALAAYNAGYGHVLDARCLAAQKGWNPNIWFDHTEKALALLEEQRYASRAKFGYCRASETIPYVRNIMLNTYHYRKLLEARAASRSETEAKNKKDQSSPRKKEK